MKGHSVARWGFVVLTLCAMLGWSGLSASTLAQCPPPEQGCSYPEQAEYCSRTALLMCGAASSCCYGVCEAPQSGQQCDDDGNQCYCILGG